MDIYKLMDMVADLSTVICLVTNLMIAIWSFKSYQKTQLPGSILLFSASLLSVADIIVNISLARVAPDENTLNYWWIAMELTWISNVILYTVAISKILRHTLKNRLT